MATPDKPTVDTNAAPDPPSENLDVVETPTSPSSTLALSRFEFEAGKGNDGTKILMVEWDTSAGVAAVPGGGDAKTQSDGNGDWEVSWEGKKTVLSIRDAETDTDGDGRASRRVYFLLPPGAPVPPTVSISQKGAAGATRPILRTKPMPAIFPKELTGGQETAGKRGVLHTIWAKKRVAELQAEIATEMKANGESVGLEMAMQERQWIVDHFGLPPVDGVPQPTRLHIPQPPAQSPASPRSPIGGRLGEKLRGLKLATSPIDLAAAAQASRAIPRSTHTQITSLSPGASDVAVSSFAMFPGRQAPQDAGADGLASLDTVLGTGTPAAAAAAETDTEEDLFALPMSPRSPEMKRSPFSLL